MCVCVHCNMYCNQAAVNPVITRACMCLIYALVHHVLQVGSTADEWGAALEAVNRLAGCSCQAPAHSMAYPGSTNSSFGGSSVAAHNSSSQSQLAGQPSVDNHAKAASGSLALDAAPLPVVTAGSATGISATATASSAGGGSSCGGASGCIGCSPASFGSAGSGAGAAELLAELSRLPCFLLMAFVEGDRLSDSPQALHVSLVMCVAVPAVQAAMAGRLCGLLACTACQGLATTAAIQLLCWQQLVPTESYGNAGFNGCMQKRLCCTQCLVLHCVTPAGVIC